MHRWVYTSMQNGQPITIHHQGNSIQRYPILWPLKKGRRISFRRVGWKEIPMFEMTPNGLNMFLNLCRHLRMCRKAGRLKTERERSSIIFWKQSIYLGVSEVEMGQCESLRSLTLTYTFNTWQNLMHGINGEAPKPEAQAVLPQTTDTSSASSVLE